MQEKVLEESFAIIGALVGAVNGQQLRGCLNVWTPCRMLPAAVRHAGPL